MADRKDRIAVPRTSKESLDELVRGVRTRTNLSEATVRDLLSSGWKFVQNLGQPDRWVRNI